MGISFEMAEQNGLISNKVIKLLPRKCKCGAPLEFSDSLREIRCTNKKCKQYNTNRAKQFFKSLGINIDSSSLYTVVDKLNIITPYQLMMLPEAYENNMITKSDVHDIDKIVQSIKNIKQESYLLYEVVKLCCIENIDKIAYKIFDGFESIEAAYNEIEVGQISFINERLGVKSSDSSILSVEIYNELLELKEELIFGETQFNIHKDNANTLYIAFTDNTIPFVNKSELMDWLNNKYSYKFIQLTTISENVDIIIRNANSTSSKIRVARLINEKYIADAINKNILSLGDINQFRDSQFKPIGQRIYIDTLEKVISRLNHMMEIQHGE